MVIFSFLIFHCFILGSTFAAVDAAGLLYAQSSLSEVAAFYGLNLSHALQQYGPWGTSSGLFVVDCGGGALDGENSSCVFGITYQLTPMYLDTATQAFAPGASYWVDLVGPDGTLDGTRKTCGEVGFCGNVFRAGSVDWNNATYVYGLNTYLYSPPAAFVNASSWINFTSPQMPANSYESIISSVSDMFNYYNASVLSLRSLYGVGDQYKGTNETVQGTSLAPGYLSAVSIPALDTYLATLSISHNELLVEFGGTGSRSFCSDHSMKSSDPCHEQDLDVQTLQGIAPFAMTAYFSQNIFLSPLVVQGSIPTLQNFVDNIAGRTVKPDVISWSWGVDYLTPNDIAYIQDSIKSYEAQLKRLAMMNITIVVSSGDSGASASTEGCLVNDPVGLYQTWPAMSPWVVSVGATAVTKLSPDEDPVEIACSSALGGGITSGGGFSAKQLPSYTTPDWQKRAVKTYLESNGPASFSRFPNETSAPGFNPNGRGFPDVAAYGAFMPTVSSSLSLSAQSGTSLSAPVVAGLFTLANQALVERGYSKIGYANPMLYWMGEHCPEAFTDVTVGSNVADMNGNLCQVGYPASPGWDPVTGWGTINFAPFVQCAMRYQDLQSSGPAVPLSSPGSGTNALDLSAGSGAGSVSSGCANVARMLPLLYLVLYVLKFGWA